LKLIKRLLHQEGFTIAGANKYIRENGIDPSNIESASSKTEKPADAPSKPAASSSETRRALAEMRRDLESIHKLLGDD
jgi:DNA-binding transcriptional MerR regulator